MQDICWEEFVNARIETKRVMYSGYPETEREKFQGLVETHVRNRISPKWLRGITTGGWSERDESHVLYQPRHMWQIMYVEALREIKLSIGRELSIITGGKF